VLELTETALAADADATTRRLGALHDLGVRIAVDDFGTGYSSLAYLRRFPVDALKIDRSFVSAILPAGEQRPLVRTMVQLGRDLGLEVIAEGIEERYQLDRLREEGCHTGQGYLFSRPLEPDALEELLSSWVPDAGHRWHAGGS
jgi:EAL domain-containing protein (putative c-di-GMP-specific phosphodiesterase class I)